MQETNSKRRGGAGWFIAMVLIIALALALAGGYFWQQREWNARVAGGQELDRIDARISARIEQAEKRLETFDERLDRTENNFAEENIKVGQQVREEIDALSDSLAALHNAFGKSVDRWSLEEVERLLVIANQRLQLSADVELARNALRLADGRLRQLGRSTPGPAIDSVRTMVADEIAALDEVATVDVVGTLNALAALARNVHILPLAGDGYIQVRDDTNIDDASEVTEATENAPEPSGGARSLWWDTGKEFLADLSALVQVDTEGKSATPILEPELRRMMFERTGLILESCQVAFLRERGDLYAARMAAAKDWVTENFDTDSTQVSVWLARWAKLAAVSPQVELPDISASLHALRKMMAAQE